MKVYTCTVHQKQDIKHLPIYHHTTASWLLKLSGTNETGSSLPLSNVSFLSPLPPPHTTLRGKIPLMHPQKDYLFLLKDDIKQL